MDRGRAKDVVYLEFYKAFDMIPARSLSLNWRDTELMGALFSGQRTGWKVAARESMSKCLDGDQ